MREKFISKQPVSKTDWTQVNETNDEDIKFDEDSPPTRSEDWATAIVHKGLPLPRKKTQIALRVDDDVLIWFKNQGPGYQSRINTILKAYKDAHEKNEVSA